MSNDDRPDISRFVFRMIAVVVLFASVFAAGLFSGGNRNAVYRWVEGIRQDFALVIEGMDGLKPGARPVHFLQPSRQPGAGVTINRRDDGALVMLSGFIDGGNEIRLIRRDGTVVARWPVKFFDHFPNPDHLSPQPASEWNVDLHGALVNPDGSVVFNYEYAGTVKLSRCGEVMWTLRAPMHHSVERAERGGYWILDRTSITAAAGDPFPPFTPPPANGALEDDLIALVGEDGTVIDAKSISRILYDNGLEPLMTATGLRFTADAAGTRELVHANKVGELPAAIAAAFPMFEPGDLVVSLRKRNLVFVVDPDTWQVKWHRTGPWRRQHDPEFNADGTITVFNNNAYYSWLDHNDRTRLDRPKVTNILRIDPATDQARVAYGGRPGQEMLSVIRGKHDPTPQGGFFITEFEAGRVIETDVSGNIVWEYINRYDDDFVLEMTEARLYPAGYFQVQDWQCPG